MADSNLCHVQFTTGSVGPRSADVLQLPLTLVDGQPPRLQTDPTPAHPGEWLFVRKNGERFV
jgi:hypothetical protein